ncbi:hypothetical protein CVT25_007122 [Psilocybe cyanescens]|uniref:Copper transporter n=1 Tax=Psilocybe cyanescens TaxID=93625 RepID=A0A409WVR6_PSICY|nr:hypothetical protein CVT25_007122 [Psilocybe cyanescens]
MLLWKYSPSRGMMFIQIFLFHAFIVHAISSDQDVVGQPPAGSGKGANETGNHLLCTPFGSCEPCPSDAMNEPFCQPFGNRRLMHCLNSTTESSSSPQQGSTNHAIPEIPAWESCGRIISKERADFYEFVACNVLFALVALGVLVFRERRLRLGRARMLAARIGIGGGAGLDPLNVSSSMFNSSLAIHFLIR